MFWFKRNEHKKGIYTNKELDTGFYKAKKPYSFYDEREGLGVYKKVDNSSYLWLPRIGGKVNKIGTENRIGYNDTYGKAYFGEYPEAIEAIEVDDFVYANYYNNIMGQRYPIDRTPFETRLLVKKNDFSKGYNKDFVIVSYTPDITGYTYFGDWKFQYFIDHYGVKRMSFWKEEVFIGSAAGSLYALAWTTVKVDVYKVFFDSWNDWYSNNPSSTSYTGSYESFLMLVLRPWSVVELSLVLVIPNYDPSNPDRPHLVVGQTYYGFDTYKDKLNYSYDITRDAVLNDLWNFPYGSLMGYPLNPYFLRYRYIYNQGYIGSNMVGRWIDIVSEIIYLDVFMPSSVKIGNKYIQLKAGVNYSEDDYRVIFCYKNKLWGIFTYNGKKYVCRLGDFTPPTTSI